MNFDFEISKDDCMYYCLYLLYYESDSWNCLVAYYNNKHPSSSKNRIHTRYYLYVVIRPISKITTMAELEEKCSEIMSK